MFATAVVFSILMLATYGQVCPNYNICAKENSYCGCAGTIHIGVGTAWETKAVSVGSKCRHSTMRLNDPAPGKYKYCVCDQENLSRSFNLEFCANEGGDCSCDDGLVWWGVHSTWTHNRVMGSTKCDRTVFGNVPFGPKKTCLCMKNWWYLQLRNFWLSESCWCS